MGCSKKKQSKAAIALRNRAEERVCGEAGTQDASQDQNDELLKLVHGLKVQQSALEKENAELCLFREADLLRLVHELKVQQVELEMQNEELCLSQQELELSRDKYAALYDFAPVSYFAFDRRGVIQEVNFTGAQKLGMEKRELLNKSFVGFIVDAAGKNILLSHLDTVLQKQAVQRCEVSFRSNNGRVITGQFQSTTMHNDGHNGQIFSTITDITCHKQMQSVLHDKYLSLEGTVQEQTEELIKANERLSCEIDDRKVTADSLREALTIIKHLKEQLREENRYLRDEIDTIYSNSNFVGDSQAIRAALKQVGQVAPTEATVLIQGETGTGKELLAHAIHNQSARKDRLMITVNCAALPPSLIESELFGREKGAFTGAQSQQIGRFELANSSTIFLDEVDALSLELQAKLLRVLECGEFQRLGNPRTIKVDVRIISATNRDLAALVKEGSFRQDMYYRLNIFQITVPPLRERREDILPLAWSFVQEFNRSMDRQIDSISSKSVQAMQAYPWPGNVRELKNVTERAMIVATGSVLHVELPSSEPLAPASSGTLEDVEKRHIVDVLDGTGWRVSGKNGAAAILGLNPKTLESRMQRLGIQRNKKNC